MGDASNIVTTNEELIEIPTLIGRQRGRQAVLQLFSDICLVWLEIFWGYENIKNETNYKKHSVLKFWQSSGSGKAINIK